MSTTVPQKYWQRNTSGYSDYTIDTYSYNPFTGNLPSTTEHWKYIKYKPKNEDEDKPDELFKVDILDLTGKEDIRKFNLNLYQVYELFLRYIIQNKLIPESEMVGGAIPEGNIVSARDYFAILKLEESNKEQISQHNKLKNINPGFDYTLYSKYIVNSPNDIKKFNENINKPILNLNFERMIISNVYLFLSNLNIIHKKY